MSSTIFALSQYCTGAAPPRPKSARLIRRPVPAIASQIAGFRRHVTTTYNDVRPPAFTSLLQTTLIQPNTSNHKPTIRHAHEVKNAVRPPPLPPRTPQTPRVRPHRHSLSRPRHRRHHRRLLRHLRRPHQSVSV